MANFAFLLKKMRVKEETLFNTRLPTRKLFFLCKAGFILFILPLLTIIYFNLITPEGLET